MRLCISGQTIGEIKDLEAVITAVKSFGLSAIEIWPVNIAAAGRNISYGNNRYEGRDIQKAKDLLKEYGVDVACVTMPGAFDEAMSNDVKEYSEALRYTVETAYELGARVVNHYCYYLALDEKPDFKKLMRYFEPALTRAEELGVKLALENEAHDATGTPAGMLSIIEAVGSENFCTNYDACNYYHASQEGFPYAYEKLKRHIAYIHIKGGSVFAEDLVDAGRNKGSIMTGWHAPAHICYTPIADGAVNIDGLIARAERDGYRGYFTLEPHVKPDKVESYCLGEVEYLRSRGFDIR